VSTAAEFWIQRLSVTCVCGHIYKQHAWYCSKN